MINNRGCKICNVFGIVHTESQDITVLIKLMDSVLGLVEVFNVYIHNYCFFFLLVALYIYFCTDKNLKVDFFTDTLALHYTNMENLKLSSLKIMKIPTLYISYINYYVNQVLFMFCTGCTQSVKCFDD